MAILGRCQRRMKKTSTKVPEGRREEGAAHLGLRKDAQAREEGGTGLGRGRQAAQVLGSEPMREVHGCPFCPTFIWRLLGTWGTT